MRPVREITAEQENFRMEERPPFAVIRRDYIEPEPIGTIILTAFRITGYNKDCDGSAMAQLEHIGKDGEPTGAKLKNMGLYPDTELVVTLEEYAAMFTPTPTAEKE